jgi:hypothetical protein
MSDNHQRYSSIKKALMQMYPKAKGQTAKAVNTLAGMINGIVGSKSTNYGAIASKTPDRAKLESRVKRFSRWVNQGGEEDTLEVMPFAKELLEGLAEQTLVLVMDGSEVGRKCLALMVSVVYHGRALPIAWLVVKGSKGHRPESEHIQLAKKVQELAPTGADVVFLGDGEFDGSELQAALSGFGWIYVCRTASNTILTAEGEEFSLQSLSLHPGQQISLPEVLFTRQNYGPIHAIAWWRKGYLEPIYLVTNLALMEEACHWYAKRFRIETFFSDQKSRGFNLHKSHLSAPHRVCRLMIASCLAYVWMIYLGTVALKTGLDKTIHRSDRCDLSLFQLGLRLLDHFLNLGKAIPVAFTLAVG